MSFTLFFLCRGETSHRFPEQHHGRVHRVHSIIWWTCNKVRPPIIKWKKRIKLLTEPVDSFEQIRWCGEAADHWTGEHEHWLTGIQRQLAVCWCKGSNRKEHIWEGKSSQEFNVLLGFLINSSLTWSCTECWVLTFYAPSHWNSYTFFCFFSCQPLWGQRSRSSLLMMSFVFLGAAPHLLWSFQPMLFRCSWIPAVIILFSAHKEWCPEEHLRWVARAHLSHGLHP